MVVKQSLERIKKILVEKRENGVKDGKRDREDKEIYRLSKQLARAKKSRVFGGE